MSNNIQHFKVIKQKNYLYVIQEKISAVHPVYTNDPVNLYVLLGIRAAALLDTGCGLHPLRPIVEDLIGQRELLVFNTHAHWDHVLGNEEFGEVYIHENEAHFITKPYNLSFLKNSPCEMVKQYREKNFLIPPAQNVKILKDGDVFNLGELKIKIIHSPGHSPGSICLLTDKNELFTSDVAYYGDTFLPERRFFPIVLDSLTNLIDLQYKNEDLELYPSHGELPCDKALLIDLFNEITDIETNWETKELHDFFHAWRINGEKFKFFISIG